jgi:hypothetical protein
VTLSYANRAKNIKVRRLAHSGPRMPTCTCIHTHTRADVRTPILTPPSSHFTTSCVCVCVLGCVCVREQNKPRINEDPKDAMLREFQEEIERLRAQLAAQEKVCVCVLVCV